VKEKVDKELGLKCPLNGELLLKVKKTGSLV